MVLWRSPHPNLDIPEHRTTWQWAFEDDEHSQLLRFSRHGLGSYINADTKASLRYDQVKDLAERLSTVLIHEIGIKPCETVSVFSTNSIWYPVVMWASVRVGCRFNGSSPAYSAAEMTHAMRTAETKLVFTLPGSLQNTLAAAQATGIPMDHVFLLEGESAGVQNAQQMIEQASRYPPTPSWSVPAGMSNKDVCGYLNFSSGTTGLPKSVMLSHHNIIAQCLQLKHLQLVTPEQPYRNLAAVPLFHITGLIRYCHFPVCMNGSCIMMPVFNFERMLQNIIEYRIEELILVPPIIIRLAKDPIVDKYIDDLRRVVRRWSSGSAPTAAEVIQQLHKKFPETGFRQGYGATESTACISAHPVTHFDYKYSHTGGMLVANTVAKVIDLDDPSKELGVGETGEICAKGPQIAMGYLNNADATAETFDKNGFLHTGDLGYIDAEGLLHIEDRLKEMIKVKGQQVAPAELEDLLLGHDMIDDCAVLGIPDDYAGERPKAYVVLKPGLAPSIGVGQQILAFVKEKKVRYKWLREVEFTRQVPKSPTGKLLRRILKTGDRDAHRARGIVVRDEDKPKARL